MPDAPESTHGLPAPTRRTLRELATRAVEAAARGDSPPSPPGDGVLGEPRAVFVSLHGPGHALRGCIGSVQAARPLGETVVAMATAAATRDPRFDPVRPEELDELSLELSVLTPFEVVRDAGGVVPGRHGLMVRGRGRSGLLLPQVARDLGWGPEEFLDATCRKAGLPADAWRAPDVSVERFEAEVF